MAKTVYEVVVERKQQGRVLMTLLAEIAQVQSKYSTTAFTFEMPAPGHFIITVNTLTVFDGSAADIFIYRPGEWETQLRQRWETRRAELLKQNQDAEIADLRSKFAILDAELL